MKKSLGLKALADIHPYYCSPSNYTDSEAGRTFPTWQDFYEEYKDADIDYNLIFRWDIEEVKYSRYSLRVFVMQQRRGHFMPELVESIEQADVPQMMELFSKHWEYIQKIWSPLSKEKPKLNTLDLKNI